MYDRKTAVRPFHLSTTFYDISVSCKLFPKAEISQIGANAYEPVGTEGLMSWIFLTFIIKIIITYLTNHCIESGPNTPDGSWEKFGELRVNHTENAANCKLTSERYPSTRFYN